MLIYLTKTSGAENEVGNYSLDIHFPDIMILSITSQSQWTQETKVVLALDVRFGTDNLVISLKNIKDIQPGMAITRPICNVFYTSSPERLLDVLFLFPN